MRTTMPTVPTDRLEAVLHGAKGAAGTALERGQELMETDAAQEILRRAGAVVSAAKGLENLQVSTHKARRWPFAALMLGTGAALGAAAALLSKRMSTPVPDTFDAPHDYPVKGGTVDLTEIDEPILSEAPTPEMATAKPWAGNGQPQTDRKKL